MKKYIFLIICLICFDTLSKFWAEKLLDEKITLIPWIFFLEYAQNTGIAFSIPLSGVILKVLTLVLIFGIFYYYYTQERWKKSILLHIWYSLIFAGALGNAWERIFRWYVTDFIWVEYFAIFNLADSYISIWACMLLYFYFRNS